MVMILLRIRKLQKFISFFRDITGTSKKLMSCLFNIAIVALNLDVLYSYSWDS